MERPPRLTAEEVKGLPEFTEITVVWCGGNGPCRYVTRKDAHGRTFAAIPNPRGRDVYQNRPLEFLGDAPPFTQVWLTAGPAGT